MLRGLVGISRVTVLHLAVLLPQLLSAVTHTLPETNEEEKFIVMLLVPAPAATVASEGNVQVYPSAPDTAATEYTTPLVPGQTFAIPLIVPGMDGTGPVFTWMVIVLEP